METERKKLAKKYEKIKLIVSITESTISLALILLFVSLGWSKNLESLAASYTANPYLELMIFVLILGVISQILSFPFDYFFGFRIEHKFGLSNLTFGKWIIEGLKSL